MGKDVSLLSRDPFLYPWLKKQGITVYGRVGWWQSFLGVPGDLFDLQKIVCARN